MVMAIPEANNKPALAAEDIHIIIVYALPRPPTPRQCIIIWWIKFKAISASGSEVQFILEFLQRRKLEAEKAKQLCLAMARTILERKPVPVIARVIDVLLRSYSHAIKAGNYYKRIITVETPQSGASNVNRSKPVANESAGTDTSGKDVKQGPVSGTGNESYSRSNVPTSESDYSLKMNSNYPDSSTGKTEDGYLLETGTSSGEDLPTGQSQILGPGSDRLDTSGRYQTEVTSSAAASPEDFYSSVFAPVEEEMTGYGSYLTAIIVEFLRSASLEKLQVHHSTHILMVALQLLESGRQNLQIRKLGLDMLRQLALHHDYALLLVQDGYYLEALRYARKNKVSTVRPSLFLEAAYASKDPQHLTAVLRFLSDFMPGFKSSSDHHMFRGTVAEMN